MTATYNPSAASRIKRHALQALFPLTLPWVPLFFFAGDLYGAAPEGSLWHYLIENFLIPGVLAASILISLILYHIRPDFLRIPANVSVRFLVSRIIIHFLLVYLVLTVLVLFFSLLIDPPPWDSKSPQYIPLVFFAVIFYPPLLTPVIAIISIWKSACRKAGKPAC